MHTSIRKLQYNHKPKKRKKVNKIPDLIFNNQIMEICNNWDYVLTFFHKIKNNTITQVTEMEHDWYTFITSYNIQLDTFKGPEEFMELLWQTTDVSQPIVETEQTEQNEQKDK